MGHEDAELRGGRDVDVIDADRVLGNDTKLWQGLEFCLVEPEPAEVCRQQGVNRRLALERLIEVVVHGDDADPAAGLLETTVRLAGGVLGPVYQYRRLLLADTAHVSHDAKTTSESATHRKIEARWLANKVTVARETGPVGTLGVVGIEQVQDAGGKVPVRARIVAVAQIHEIMAFVPVQVGLIREVFVHVHPLEIQAVRHGDLPVELKVTDELGRGIHVETVENDCYAARRDIGLIGVTRVTGRQVQ